MDSNLSHLIDSWKSLNVLVIGDVMLDCYLNGSSDRLCQEAPVPVVEVTQRQDFPGGAGNVAANISSLGAKVSLLSVVGDDAEGDRLYHVLQQQNISTEFLLTTSKRTTLSKQRVVANSHLLLRFDQGSTDAIVPELEQQIIDRLFEQFFQSDAVVISDYGYGVLTPNIIHTLSELQAKSSRTVVVDSKQLEAYEGVGVTAVKPNYKQVTQLLGLTKQPNQRVEQITPFGDRILELTGAAIATVTLDAEGAIVFERGQNWLHIPAQTVPQHQTSGAGDTFVSALTLALAAGAPTCIAASLASAAASVAIQQPGTTTCSASSLHQALQKNDKLISDYSDLVAYVQQYHAANRKIVLTNGCFDILHSGHINYLTQAKALGDILIVGVNTDESVRQLKGKERPINSLEDRLAVLSALSCVDRVVPFGDLTPHNLIRIIRPNIFVKGGDYTRETLPEADLVEELGGTVKILPYISGFSTTNLIQRIKS